MGNCNINKHVYNLKNDYQKNTPSRVLRHYHSQFFLSDETEDQVDTDQINLNVNLQTYTTS